MIRLVNGSRYELVGEGRGGKGHRVVHALL